MSKPTFTEERKAEVLQLIKQHLAEYGQQKYSLLFASCPDIQQTTVWTWIKKVREDAPSQAEIKKAHQEIHERVLNRTIDHLPAIPMPAAVAKGGERVLRELDFSAEIPKLYDDAVMLRDFATTWREDMDKKMVEKIKNPVTFEKSIKTRAMLIRDIVGITRSLWDMRMMQQFQQAMIEEIGKADLDTKKRILERLRLLNESAGMTMVMRV